MLFLRTILKCCYHRLFSLKFRKRIHSRRKLAKMTRKNPSIKKQASDGYIKGISEYWLKNFGLKIDPGWHIAYASVNGLEDPGYVPEYVFFTEILPRLNRTEMYPFYTDKNNYDKLFKNFLRPRTILRKVNGKLYYPDYTEAGREGALCALLDYKGALIIKPSIDTGQGKNIRGGRCRSGSIYLEGRESSLEEIESLYKSDFLIQERVIQHPFMSRFHPDSLNTARIMTLRLEGNIRVVSSIARFGSMGRIIDNQTEGGVCAGVDYAGNLDPFGIDITGKKFFQHPSSGEEFEGASVPGFHKITGMAAQLHGELAHFDIASWDIGLNCLEEPVLIELNLVHQSLDIHQFSSGPVLKDYLGKIMPGTGAYRDG